MDIEKLFKLSGLNETESSLMLLLIQHERLTAAEVSKLTGIKRTTVYAGLANLEAVNLVSKVVANSVSKFSAASNQHIPKILENLALDEFRQVQTATNNLSSKLEAIQRSKKVDFSDFEVSSIGSYAAVWAEVEKVLLQGDYYSIFNPQQTIQGARAKQLILDFLIKTAKTKPLIKELAVAGPTTDWYLANIKYPNHQLRVLPKSLELITDMIISENRVIIFHYQKNNEQGISIKNSEYYQTMKALFEHLWQVNSASQ